MIICVRTAECASPSHFSDCATLSDAERAQRYKALYEGALANWHKSQALLNSSFKRRDEQIELWRGKFREVKHENNKLRRRLYTKWQPIETVPKDGTEVLLAHDVEALVWTDEWMAEWVTTKGVKGHWRQYECWGYMEGGPTHWMSLPDPPK